MLELSEREASAREREEGRERERERQRQEPRRGRGGTNNKADKQIKKNDMQTAEERK